MQGFELGTIDQPGIYDLPMAEYLAQPCVGLALGSSDAAVLTNETPKHLLARWREDRSRARKADIGTAIHALVLEPARANSQIVIIDAADFKTKVARSEADEAISNGLTPLIRADYERAKRAADAVMRNPNYAALITAGVPEQVYIAKDARTGVWVKTRPDIVSAGERIVSIKTVASCAPDFLKRRVYDGGWFRQAPWECHVYERVMGAPAKDYIWLCVEQDEPYDVTHHRPTANALAHGARLNEKALSIMAECIKTNTWPGYPSGTDLDLPDYALYRLEADGLADEPKEPGRRDMRAARIAEETGANPFS